MGGERQIKIKQIEVRKLTKEKQKIYSYQTIKWIQMGNSILVIKEQYQKQIPEIIEIIKRYWGTSKYHFRKGVGSKGEIQWLSYKEHNQKTITFFRMKKNGRKIVKDTSQILKIPISEAKYIYPLVKASHISDKQLLWEQEPLYIIFPYEHGCKFPIPEEIFKQKAPKLYEYLKSHQDELDQQSVYNKRIQDRKEFYGVIRVGKYTYGNCFFIMRDHTKVQTQVVNRIRTQWGETKIPIFDGHVSYISKNIHGYPLTCQEAKRIKELFDIVTPVRAIIEGYYDNRSIGSRLPLRIEDMIKEGVINEYKDYQ